MGNKLKVSVVVPVYNVEKYLPECLDHLCKQTLKDIEIICVYDESTDNTWNVLKRYEAAQDNLSVVEGNSHGYGLAQARNIGLARAKGKYVYFLDADDYIDEDTLRVLYKRAEQEKLDMLIFRCEPFADGVDDKVLRPFINRYAQSREYPGVFQGAELYRRVRENNDYLCNAWIYIARRKFLQDNNLAFIPGILNEDQYFTLHAMLLAQRVAYQPTIFYHRRLRPDSLMVMEPDYLNRARGFLLSAVKLMTNLTGTYTAEQQREIEKELFVWLKIAREEGVKAGEAILGLPLAEQLYFRLIAQGEMLRSELERYRASYLQSQAKLDRISEVLSGEVGKRQAEQTEGMIVYGVGRHLADVLSWYPGIGAKIAKVIDKDKQKKGKKCPGLSINIDEPSVLRNLPMGTEIAISAVKYIDEIKQELYELNPGLVCKPIDTCLKKYL